MKKLLSLLTIALALILITTPTLADEKQTYIIDAAHILNDDAKGVINTHLEKVSDKQNTNTYAVIVYSIYDEDINDYASQLLEEYLEPLEKNKEGVLLLIVLDSRNYALVTDEYAGQVVDKAALEAITTAIVPPLSEDNYVEAFKQYGDEVEKAYKNKDKSPNKEVTTLPKKAKELFSLVRLGGSLVVGSLIALFMASRSKAQLKTIRTKQSAESYLTKSDIKKDDNSDLLLYEKTTKKPKEKKEPKKGEKASTKGKF